MGLPFSNSEVTAPKSEASHFTARGFVAAPLPETR